MHILGVLLFAKRGSFSFSFSTRLYKHGQREKVVSVVFLALFRVAHQLRKHRALVWRSSLPLGATVPPQAALRSDPGVEFTAEEHQRWAGTKGREGQRNNETTSQRIIYAVIAIDHLSTLVTGKSDALLCGLGLMVNEGHFLGRGRDEWMNVVHWGEWRGPGTAAVR